MTISKRRAAREETMQMLYSLELSGKSPDDVLNDGEIFHPAENPFDAFTVSLFKKTCETFRECDNYIQKQAVNWEISRFTLIDRIILRMAITEFLHFPDIPPKVTINEALEISRKFSTSESVKFINGILDGVLAELKNTKKLYKEGRGLINDRKK